MMKKKLEGLLLLLCLALSGCGNREAQAVVPFPSAQAAEEVPGQPKDNTQQLHFSGDEESAQLTVQVIPAVQSGYRTVYAADAGEQRRIYDFLEEISVNVRISDEGIVSEVK